MAEESVVDAVSPAQLFSRESGRGPKRVRAGDLGVGRRLPDVTFIDLAGRHHSLASVGDAKALLFAMTSTSCPISRKYLPTLAALIKNPDFKEVRWICINPIATDSQEDMLAAAKTLGPHVIYVHDREGLLSQAIDTRTTADAIVFDSARTVLYHGAIDDQYGLGYSLESPRHHYLSNAISAVMTQRRPEPAATVAPGCAIHVKNRTTADTQTSLTYHNRIARIVQHHCLECRIEECPKALRADRVYSGVHIDMPFHERACEAESRVCLRLPEIGEQLRHDDFLHREEFQNAY